MRKDNSSRLALFDKRVVDRNIKKGLVTRDDYEKFVASQKDAAENAEAIRARLGADDVEETDSAEG